ncbi:MAG: lysophospholipid acyltransferase family protein [Pseudomonadota bacterium]|nr:lysophospholipid acyltransferase family protein [Pseudomonadota bacterium]
MPSIRKFARRPVVTAALSWLAACYLRIVWRTGRWTIENQQVATSMVAGGKPFIACFWHGRMLMIPNAWVYKAPVSILISHHRDGTFISRTLDHLGVGTISGSSSKGGGSALIAIVRALKRGEYIGITPDGPRGPRMRVAPGAIFAAKLSGAALLPVTFAASRCRVFMSWDRFILPFPFTRGVIRIGDPIDVPCEMDDIRAEEIRQKLERVLTDLTMTLDSELGHEPISPEEFHSVPEFSESRGSK